MEDFVVPLIILVGFVATLVLLMFKRNVSNFSSGTDLMYNLGDNSLRDGDPYAEDAYKFAQEASLRYMDRDDNPGFFT